MMPGGEGGQARGWRSWLLVGALALPACSTAYVGRAERDYRAGRYLEVAEELARHEGQLASLSSARQARYGLYRGLSLLKLGDYRGAQRWFGFVENIERAAPTLNAARQRLLQVGRHELATMLRHERGAPPPRRR